MLHIPAYRLFITMVLKCADGAFLTVNVSRQCFHQQKRIETKTEQCRCNLTVMLLYHFILTDYGGRGEGYLPYILLRDVPSLGCLFSSREEILGYHIWSNYR